MGLDVRDRSLKSSSETDAKDAKVDELRSNICQHGNVRRFDGSYGTPVFQGSRMQQKNGSAILVAAVAALAWGCKSRLVSDDAERRGVLGQLCQPDDDFVVDIAAPGSRRRMDFDHI